MKTRRDLGEDVELPEGLVESFRTENPNKSLYQIKGLVLDHVEKLHYSTTLSTETPLTPWIPSPGKYDPYDVKITFINDAYVDFKLATAKTLTISNRECEFANQHHHYWLYVYVISEDGNSATYVGSVKYSKIKHLLNPSSSGTGKFVWLSDIQDLLE